MQLLLLLFWISRFILFCQGWDHGKIVNWKIEGPYFYLVHQIRHKLCRAVECLHRSVPATHTDDLQPVPDGTHKPFTTSSSTDWLTAERLIWRESASWPTVLFPRRIWRKMRNCSTLILEWEVAVLRKLSLTRSHTVGTAYQNRSAAWFRSSSISSSFLGFIFSFIYNQSPK